MFDFLLTPGGVKSFVDALKSDSQHNKWDSTGSFLIYFERSLCNIISRQLKGHVATYSRHHDAYMNQQIINSLLSLNVSLGRLWFH